MSLLKRLLLPACLLALPATASASTEVLWYNGNNGDTSTDYATLQSTIEGAGGTFTATSTFPSSLTDYRVVFLVEPARLFSPTALTVLEEYLAGDGLLVLVGDSGGEAGSLGVLMNLTDDLGIGTTFSAEEYDTGCGTDGDGAQAVKAEESTLNECVDSLSYAGSSELTLGTGASSLFTGESDQILVALDGNVLLVADSAIFFDTCTFSGDNEKFFQQIYAGISSEDATDADCDGYGPTSEGGLDCDDGDATVNPDGIDICDDLDNDCNGSVDDDPAYGSTWYMDADDDGYGVNSGTTVACDDPTGYADNTRDCDDDDATRNPGADETCDDEDDNCDGTIDENPVDGTTWYADVDEDGYGSSTDSKAACEQPDGYIEETGDCDDTLSRVHPDAEEYCNEADDDCDGDVDEDAANGTTWYTDADGDTYGDPNDYVESCDAPSGAVSDGRDCDDTDPAIYPGAPGWTVTCQQLDDGSEDTGGDKEGGCNCSSASGNPAWWALLPLGALVARRRRQG